MIRNVRMEPSSIPLIPLRQLSGMPKLHRRLVRERIMLADLESVPLI